MSKFRSMIQRPLTLILVLLTGLTHSQARGPGNDPVRPMILVTPADRAGILNKIETQEWAKTIYADFMDRLYKEIEVHQANPEEFLKEMPFDWEKSKPGETPPFTYTIHVNPNNGQRTNLDNGTPEEMANARKLIRFMDIGVDCGMAYYITEDEKYAQCAADILNAFVKGVMQMERSDYRWRGGWLFPDDGFLEVRAIGEKIPLIYDFIAEFVREGGQAYDLGKRAAIDFPLEETQEVFRNYADITINRGHTGTNWSILEARNLVYNALAMEDENEREELLSYFLTENTRDQDALNVIAMKFKEEGDIWPESSNYLNAVSTRLTHLMLIVNRYDPSLRLGEKYSNIMFALPVHEYLVYPNNEIIRWGDGHRSGRPPYSSYEDAYLLGKMDGVEKITNTFRILISRALEQGKYQRRGMNAVLMHGVEFNNETDKFILPRTDNVKHAGIFLQRNLSSTGDPVDGLMCFAGGAHMTHGHAEGMNIELYGEGQVLGVDNGRGKYQQDVHENYSRIFAAHNTIIVNGSSRGDSGWAQNSINTVQLISMEPMPRAAAVSPDYSFTQTSFVDDRGDKAEAIQERTLALIRTSPTTGYYVDVFRSKSKLPNEFHDYLYHNIGDRLELLNADMKLAPTPERYQANADLPWVQNKTFRYPGWHFFDEVYSSSVYTTDVKAQFFAEQLENAPVCMKLHIPGFSNREYTKVMAPPTFEAPDPYVSQSTPTLVIRKKGEAWAEPFVVVYEPFSGDAKNASIVSVEKLEQEGVFKGLKIESEADGKRLVQLVLTQSKDQVLQDDALKIYFKGSFALISLNAENQVLDMYIGEGDVLQYGGKRLKSDPRTRAAYMQY